MMKFTAVFFVLVAVLVSGCSGGVKDANEKNFKAAAQAFLDVEYPSSYFITNYPYKTDRIAFNNMPDVLKVLDKLGIVKGTEISRKDIPASYNREARVEIIYSYELTDEGNKFYRPDARTNTRGESWGGFSFGKAKIVKIVNFTEPTDYMGYKVARATYTYTVSDIPAWAKDAELLGLDKQLKKDVESANTPIERTDIFVLTDKGWIHETLMQK